MDPQVQGQALKELRGKNRNQAFVITLLSLLLLVQGVALVSLVGSDRTIVVPPNLTKSFWVTSSKASADYLEQMAAFMGWLVLDVSPASIDWKKDTLLTYMSPDKYGAMKNEEDVQTEKLKRLNAATQFSPQQIVVDEPNQSVVLRGRLRTLINGQDATNDQKAYLAQFKYAGGRIHLETFKEIPYENQPIGQGPASAPAAAGAAAGAAATAVAGGASG